MLSHVPMVLGLTLCEDVIVEAPTRNVSLIRSFSGLAVEQFPAVARPFCVFAALTDGFGEAEMELRVTIFADVLEDIYRVRRKLRFTDRLQTVYYLMRLSRCPLPRAGAYLFTLQLDGEWQAQRSLRVYPSEPMS